MDMGASTHLWVKRPLDHAVRPACGCLHADLPASNSKGAPCGLAGLQTVCLPIFREPWSEFRGQKAGLPLRTEGCSAPASLAKAWLLLPAEGEGVHFRAPKPGCLVFGGAHGLTFEVRGALEHAAARWNMRKPASRPCAERRPLDQAVRHCDSHPRPTSGLTQFDTRKCQCEACFRLQPATPVQSEAGTNR